MPPKWVYFQADGTNSTAAQVTHAQAKAIAAPGSLFVYGGDVYDNGTDADFVTFDGVYGDVRKQLVAIPGNHDWNTANAQGYENYWLSHAPPDSLTSIDTSQAGTDRHHFALPLGNGWLGIMIDCGSAAEQPLTPLALTQIDNWITAHGSRNVIIFPHNARLTRGQHGDNTALDPLWQACFDSAGLPRVVAWVAGHNHNLGVYSPRGKGSGAGAVPPASSLGIANGVQIFINGAGGAGFYSLSVGAFGTMPDLFGDDAHFGFLQIKLIDADTAIFQNFATSAAATGAASTIGPAVGVSLAP